MYIEQNWNNINELEFDKEDALYAWNLCHNAFYGMKDKKKLNDSDKDYLALQLSQFLSAYGMYRKGFIKTVNYTKFIDIVNIVMDEQYKELFDSDELIINDIEKYKKLIFDEEDGIFNKIRYYYKRNNDTPYPFTTIMVTKILMGVFGCIIAFDTKVSEKLDLHSCSKDIIEDKMTYLLTELIENDKYYYNRFEQFRRDNNMNDLTIIRMLDFILWYSL